MKFPCYLTHPKHGTHIAYDPGEVERHVEHYGWTVAGIPGTQPAKPTPPEPVKPPAVKVEPKKRGRPRKS